MTLNSFEVVANDVPCKEKKINNTDVEKFVIFI